MWADAVPNLLIGLREGLEAGLVVSILLAAVRRAAKPDEPGPSAAPVWLGTLCAVTLALSFGAVLTFYSSALSTRAQEGFGGVLSVAAVGLVTAMIFWMRRAARTMSGELATRATGALRIGAGALALTAFMAVGREGIETALFIWTAAHAAGQTAAPLTGAAVGLTAAVALCWLLYRRAVRLNLGVFFSRTAVLLIIIAAGVLASGIGDLQDAGLLPGHTLTAFSISHAVAADSWWVSIIRGISNLSTTMTWLQVTAYLGYLLTVLAVFVRRPSLAADADAVSPAPAASAAAPAPAGMRARPKAWAAVAAAVAVPPVAAGSLIAFGPAASGPAASGTAAAAAGQRIEITATACAPGWSAAKTGSQVFTVVNKSGQAGEIRLVQSSSAAIVAEIETIGPGTQQAMPATMVAGDYTWQCRMSGEPMRSSATARAAGPRTRQAPTAVVPVTLAQLRRPAAQYRAYVAPKLATLATQVATLRSALAAGNLSAAQADWLPAQLTWEQIGAAYDSFGDLGNAIDGLPQGLTGGVNDPGFTGLHRLEYGLWHGQSATSLMPVADRLARDIAGLQRGLPQITVDPTDLPIRAHEILEDALRDHLSGMTDEGAGAAYPETYADLQGTQVVLDELAPLISARSPELLPLASQQLDTLGQSLLDARRSGQWVSLQATPLAARQRVQAAVGALLETLSDVPDLLELPPRH